MILLPAGQDSVDEELYCGTKMADVLRAFGLSEVVPGRPLYVTDELGQNAYSANIFFFCRHRQTTNNTGL
jgi:hypothetical protein